MRFSRLSLCVIVCVFLSVSILAAQTNTASGLAAPHRKSSGPSHPLIPVGFDLPDNIIAWDSPIKDYSAKPGETLAHFVFNLTNVSSEAVTIRSVTTSCGCTVAKLPAVPWELAPGSNGQILATMTLAGRGGMIAKSMTVVSDFGEKLLLVRVNISSATPRPMDAGRREKDQLVAKADRQAVFRDDCGQCHLEPVKNKTGAELYAAACGICHEAEQRAASVPDLHTVKQPGTTAYWLEAIQNGKPGSMMPGFGRVLGGPLSDEQIVSLAAYLVEAFPAVAR